MNLKHTLAAILILTTTFLSGLSGNAQNHSDIIRIDPKVTGYAFYQNDERLKIPQLLNVVRGNKEAFRLIQKGQTQEVGAYIFDIVGGLSLGFSLGYVFRSALLSMPFNEKIFYPTHVAGVVFCGVGIGIEAVAKKNMRKGVEIYNRKIKQNNSTSVDFGLSLYGAALKLNF